MTPETTTTGPAPTGPAVQSSRRQATDLLPTIMPTTTGDSDLVAGHSSLGLAMVARWFDHAGQARRRVYLTTASAESAVRRAARRGQRVEVQLVELCPVRDGLVDLVDDGAGGR